MKNENFFETTSKFAYARCFVFAHINSNICIKPTQTETFRTYNKKTENFKSRLTVYERKLAGLYMVTIKLWLLLIY